MICIECLKILVPKNLNGSLGLTSMKRLIENIFIGTWIIIFNYIFYVESREASLKFTAIFLTGWAFGSFTNWLRRPRIKTGIKKESYVSTAYDYPDIEDFTRKF